MITTLIDALNEIIAAGATPATVQAHLKTIREQAEVLERERAGLQLKANVADAALVESGNPVVDAQSTDTCPYCHQMSGILESREESASEGEAGLKIHHYKCSNKECGKTYEKQVVH